MPKSSSKNSAIKHAKAGATVLFVDDDSFIVGLYEFSLSKAGFKVVVAEDGIEGIKIAKKIRPDIILLDLVMPMMDGFEALEHIKKDRKLKDIPVVILSALNQKHDRDRACKLGAARYMCKSEMVPFDCAEHICEILGV